MWYGTMNVVMVMEQIVEVIVDSRKEVSFILARLNGKVIRGKILKQICIARSGS